MNLSDEADTSHAQNVSQPITADQAQDRAGATRLAVLSRFQAGDIQHLDGDDLAAAQRLCGHGDQLGHWLTDVPTLKKHQRDIDLTDRITNRLLKDDPEWPVEDHAALIREGVVTLTRLGLLARLEVAGRMPDARTQRLKPSTITQLMHQHWPNLVARAIQRKAMETVRGPGMFRFLTEADILECNLKKNLRNEIARVDMFVGENYWWDAPVRPLLPLVTDPGKASTRFPLAVKTPHQPLPDWWLAEIGPRVLWVVNDLAPNLLRLLERLNEQMKGIEYASRHSSSIGKDVQRLIKRELQQEPWIDRGRRPLAPPFPLITGTRRGGKRDRLMWPIKDWEHVCMLSTLVQSAHSFLALLGMAGRIGEISTLKRDCVAQHDDGQWLLHGRTYKLTRNLMGSERTWPAPDVLVRAIGQQSRLAAAWDWLPSALDNGLPTTPNFGDALWVSIGVAGRCGKDADVNLESALISLAERLGVSTRPGGINVHPHRFRKAIGRLAGIALWNSPLVLKQLFGHKDIEMTLHYILSDSCIRVEAEKVLREIRVMHCADSFQQVRNALHAGLPNPIGGAGGGRLLGAMVEHEKRLAQSGGEWETDTAYSLAADFTMKGLGWRLGIGFICSKLPHEAGECRKGASRRGARGEPLISQCKPNCAHRCELADQVSVARRQRDAEEVCAGYLAVATQACSEGQLLIAAHSLQNLKEELEDWPVLKTQYDARPELQVLIATLELEAEVTHG